MYKKNALLQQFASFAAKIISRMLNKLSAFKLILNNKLNLDYIINFYFVLCAHLHAWNNYNAAVAAEHI